MPRLLYKALFTKRLRPVLFVGLLAAIGAGTVFISNAATFTSSSEAETGAIAGNASCKPDSAASGGSAVVFGNKTVCSTSGVSAGAHLPINYALSSLTGNVRYVSPNGNDSTGTGTVSSPYATLSRAISGAASGDNIVVRGGTYRQGNMSIPSNKTLRIIAYPGEIPVFNGAQPASGWTDEGSLSFTSYTPQPVTDGSGISFTSGQNLAGDAVGKHPDQAWIGSTQLRQENAKSEIGAGEFWVDSASNRLYMTASDVDKGSVEVSQKDNFLDLNAPNSVLEGFRVTRFSNSANDYGMIDIGASADGTELREMELSDSAFQLVSFNGNNDLLNNTKLTDSTLTNGNWMGVVALYTDNFTMDSVKISGLNQFNEFTSSPQSGALKTSRTWYTKVVNSEIVNNKSYGLWFDQSNYDAIVANNYIANSAQDAADNHSSNIFYEISDKLLLINNYMVQTGAAINFKTAGSGGVSMVNNTILGGGPPVAVATDNRSMPGCSDPSKPLCANSYSSDRDSVRAHRATMDWMPRLDLLINNIIAYPTANAAYCGLSTTICFVTVNGSASAPLSTIIHKADSIRGIPQTVMNGDVFANGTGRLIRLSGSGGDYYTLNAFTAAMAIAPVSIGGLEANGLAGNSYVAANGAPTSALSSIHNQAQPIPTNAQMNAYIPAGTRHYGVTYK